MRPRRRGSHAVGVALASLLLAHVSAAAASPANSPAAQRGVSTRANRWPLEGTPRVVRPFQPPPTPYGRGHRGVDLAATEGAAVLAARFGTVSFAGVIAGRGVVVIVHDAGLRTTYEPVAAIVIVGMRVAAGDRLGVVAGAHAGCPVTACLHWGLLRGTVYLDPLSLLGRGRVRLLPMAPGAATPGVAAPTAWASGAAGLLRRSDAALAAPAISEPLVPSGQWRSASKARSWRTALVCS